MERLVQARMMIAVTGLLMLASGTAAAQGTRYDGYWGSLGVGAGGRLVSEGGETEWTTGGTFSVRMGGVLSDRFLLGGEIVLWGRDENQVFVTRGNGTVSLLFFPLDRAGFFVKGGGGGVLVRAADVSSLPSQSAITRYGFGTTLGIGYDIPFAAGLSVTPNLDFMYQWLDDPDATDAALLSLTIGVTWH